MWIEQKDTGLMVNTDHVEAITFETRMRLGDKYLVVCFYTREELPTTMVVKSKEEFVEKFNMALDKHESYVIL